MQKHFMLRPRFDSRIKCLLPSSFMEILLLYAYLPVEQALLRCRLAMRVS